MKLIIAGSRGITNPSVLEQAIVASKFAEEEITEVVSGGARGADALGEQWAAAHGVACKVMLACWDTHGKAAGPMRNKKMAEYVGPDGALLALWDGVSYGTKHMISVAKMVGMRVKVYKPIKGKPR